MLNALIVATFGLLVILIAQKYGALQFLAIGLAVMALIPFAISVYLYMYYRPAITYQLASKNATKEDDKFIYTALLGVQGSRGQVLLDGVYVGMRDVGTTLVIQGNGTSRIRMFEETNRAAIRLNSVSMPLFPKTGYGYELRFESSSEKRRLPFELIVDTKVDPAKLGFLAVFQPAYTYRLTARVEADFVDLSREEGELRTAY